MRQHLLTFVTAGLFIGLSIFWVTETPLADYVAGQEQTTSRAVKQELLEPRLPASSRPPSTIEARARATLLHETIHGALQVMHRDFFREDEKLSLPASSLEDVFSELAQSQNVQLRWIAINTKPMTIDHTPQGGFELAAVKAISSGQKRFELTESGVYRYVGAIRLTAHCLKCHHPGRNNNDERSAGLVISMPIKKN